MAKKSTGTRPANAARRSQSSAKSTAVHLVRQPGAGAESTSAGTPVMTRPTQSAPARPAGAKPAAKPTQRVAGPPRPVATANPLATARPTAARPTAAKPAASSSSSPATAAAARAQADRTQAAKVARAREIQRSRAANLITPEHYDYVIKDLRLIGILATCMFTIIIVLHFVLK
jgi:hypothetical protein